jgi:uncharacterized repeat protein (TIGR03803 family)
MSLRTASGILRFVAMLIAAFASLGIASPGQTFTTLAYFTGTNGWEPSYGSLVLASNGNLYGTTVTGGAYGDGAIFEVTPAGVLSTVYSFCSQAGCTDGDLPFAGLVEDSDGNLYGTAFSQGAKFAGTIFKFVPSSLAFSTIYTFCSQTNCTDGSNPWAGLTLGPNGNLYGTTVGGGAHKSGTFFEITTAGELSTLYSFCAKTNCVDGFEVYSPLVYATNGNFYGATLTGGTNNLGTVFQMTKTGTLTTLHSFSGTDGETPWGGLVQASNGNLYGTTEVGGARNSGTLFEITTTGKFTVVHSFCASANCPDGATPVGALMQASNGNFYGTTTGGGEHYKGTIFEITTAGVITTLHSFAGADGDNAFAGLVARPDGTFYGTTEAGGKLTCNSPHPFGCGTVFKLVP